MGKAPLIPVTNILTDRIPEAKTKKMGRLIIHSSSRMMTRIPGAYFISYIPL